MREDVVRLPNGLVVDEFHVVEYPDWACVLCLDTAGRIVLIEQYRPGIQRVCLELPAGVIEKGEKPLNAAKRELLEETGYLTNNWTLLGRCAPNPSKETSYAFLFVAREAAFVRPQRLDTSESISVKLVQPAELLELANSTRIIHGIHLTTIFWALHQGIV